MAIGSSSYSLVTQRSGQVNLMQVLSGYLRMGQYVLTIEQPRFVRFPQYVVLVIFSLVLADNDYSLLLDCHFSNFQNAVIHLSGTCSYATLIIQL